MICPQCNSEYREGFTHCAECDVALVESVPEQQLEESEEEEEGENELVNVLETIDPALLSDVVDEVEKAEIPYLVQSGTAFSLADLKWQAVLWVPQQFVDQTRDFVKQIQSPPEQEES